MANIESQGTVFAIYNGTTYDNVAQVTGVSGLGGGSATVIEASNLDSTAREFIMGLPDEGEITLELNFDPDDTEHDKLEDVRASRTLTQFKITMTDTTPTTYTFSGYVLSVSKNFVIDDLVKASVTIRVSGAVVKA